VAGPVRPRLTAPEGRRFAFTLAGAFSVLAIVLWWRVRGSSSPFAPFASFAPLFLAASLLAAGILIPTRLGPVQRAWMALAHAISRVTTPILMAVVYFTVLAPIGLAMRVMGYNPLKRHAVDGSFWVVRAPREQRSDIQRQF
jgi:hypothetical protein